MSHKHKNNKNKLSRYNYENDCIFMPDSSGKTDNDIGLISNRDKEVEKVDKNSIGRINTRSKRKNSQNLENLTTKLTKKREK